jgi:hypothetical protein
MIAPATELGRPEIWATIRQNTDRGVKIARADQERRNRLYSVLQDYSLLIAMTAKPTKFLEIIKFCERLAVSPSREHTHAAPHLPELASSNVNAVAASKAVQIFSQEEHIDPENPATQELVRRLESFFSLNHFISEEGLELVRQALPTGKIVAAADVNFYQNDGNGNWRQNHKFEREGSLSQQEILKVWQEMKQFYCYPKSGVVHVRWDNAVVMLNGQVFQFRDQLEIKSKPIDPHLFDVFMNEALANGLFYSANTHFGLIECLVANGKIISVSSLSDEEQAQGLIATDKAMSPVPSDYPVLHSGVLGNRPARLIQ